MKINPKWQAEMESKILQSRDIDYASSFKLSVQWLVLTLHRYGIPYKLTSLGAGVSHITTKNVDVCPCCKRNMQGVIK
jgi:hypothetical protein